MQSGCSRLFVVVSWAVERDHPRRTAARVTAWDPWSHVYVRQVKGCTDRAWAGEVPPTCSPLPWPHSSQGGGETRARTLLLCPLPTKGLPRQASRTARVGPLAPIPFNQLQAGMWSTPSTPGSGPPHGRGVGDRGHEDLHSVSPPLCSPLHSLAHVQGRPPAAGRPGSGPACMRVLTPCRLGEQDLEVQGAGGQLCT